MNTLFTFVTIRIPINSCKYFIVKVINTVYKQPKNTNQSKFERKIKKEKVSDILII